MPKGVIGPAPYKTAVSVFVETPQTYTLTPTNTLYGATERSQGLHLKLAQCDCTRVSGLIQVLSIPNYLRGTKSIYSMNLFQSGQRLNQACKTESK